MSNFICSTCGLTNVDCGKDGYKTSREIELEKKLDIAVKALEHYAHENSWIDCVINIMMRFTKKLYFSARGMSQHKKP